MSCEDGSSMRVLQWARCVDTAAKIEAYTDAAGARRQRDFSLTIVRQKRTISKAPALDRIIQPVLACRMAIGNVPNKWLAGSESPACTISLPVTISCSV